jgi:hypothetical protein
MGCQGGYVLGEDDGDLTGIDLDKCIINGKLDPWANEIVTRAESYCEVSPSGTGIRIIARGKIDKTFKFDPAGVEVYGTGRYLTITGNHIAGTPTEIRPAPQTVAALGKRVEDKRKEVEEARRAAKANGAGQEKTSSAAQEQPKRRRGVLWGAIYGNERDPFFRSVNTAALQSLSAWVPSLFGAAAMASNQGYRVSSKDLGRDLEEDLSFTPQGIKDWGVWDMGDDRGGKRTPIDIVLEYGSEETAADAALWLCERLAIDPASLGWRGRQSNEGAAQEQRNEGASQEQSNDGASQGQPQPPPPKQTLDELHGVYRRWFGDEYDMDAVDAVAVAAAAERLTGDPLWLLIISGPGAAKTETVQALSGCGAYITSTIQSEGALLSASSRKDRSKKATGGLLRKIGDRGILVIKDVTSILSSDRNVRASVLAAIREIYDGRWERNVGTDGGQTLTWTGRLAVVGAVTTAWDAAHAVVSAMGDRFVLLRINSNAGRKASGMRAIRNTGEEKRMREELSAALGGVVCHASAENVEVREDEVRQILNAADIVTMARTAVERDYAGEVIDAHAPEMPTRFAKQLTQMLRGGIAIGMSRQRAQQLAIRCARDSIPPLRLEILLDVARNPDTRPGDVRQRINKPWRTVKREMEALNMLGLLCCREETPFGGDKTVWRYSLADGFDRETLLAMSGGEEEADFG